MWICGMDVRRKEKCGQFRPTPTKALFGMRISIFLRGISSLKEEFERMTFDQKVSYLLANRNELPDELALDGVKVLAQSW